jgi:branched-chain amino acid transport system permease protein
MSFVLPNFVQIAQGARVKPLPPLIPGGFTLYDSGAFTIQISKVQILVMVTTLTLMTIFSLLIARTRLGRDMRACEQDRTMAALLGVDTDRVISTTFVIGAALAAVAGFMYLVYYGVVDFIMGFVAGIKAFTAAVLGGIGNLPGAVLGGLILGVIESVGPSLFLDGIGIPAPHQLKDGIAFTVLVLILIFRPSGILGERLSKRA